MNGELGQLLRPLALRLGNLFARGRVAAVKASTRMQTLQVELLAGEVKDRLEHFEPYGFTSCPHPGAEAAAAFLDGDRSHGIVLVVADRRYRLTTLAEGEMAIHDDLGQKVHLTRAGIVVKGAGLPVLITDTPRVTVEAATSIKLDAPDVQITGNLVVNQHLSYQGGLSGSNVNAGAGGSGAAIEGPLAVVGGTVTHDGKNIGSSHTHGGVLAGGASTAVPN